MKFVRYFLVLIFMIAFQALAVETNSNSAVKVDVETEPSPPATVPGDSETEDEVSVREQLMSWTECVDMTAKNNPEIKAALDRVRAFEQLESAAYGTFLPQINGTLSYTRSDSRFGGSTLGAGSINRGELYTANISGQWNLFSGLQDISKIRQAEARTEEQRGALQAVKARISSELKTSYQGLMFAKNSLKLTEEIIRRREENLRLVELRFESGLENKGSVLLSRANYEQAMYDNLQALNAQVVARAQLARTLGLDEFTQINIQGEIPVDDSALDTMPNFKDAVSINPDVVVAQAKVNSTNEGINISRSNFLPKLNVVGSAGKSEDEFFPDKNSMWSVGVNLTVPLFAGGQNFFGFRNAAASWSMETHNLENTKRVILAKMQQTFASYKESIVKLRVDRGFREATQVRAEISRKRYNNGLLTFDIWNDIENDLISRQKVYLQSGRDRVNAEAAYENALGRGVIP